MLTNLPEIMNLQEASQFLGVSRATLRKWLKSGVDIPHKRIGEKKYLFSRNALLGWVEDREGMKSQ